MRIILFFMALALSFPAEASFQGRPRIYTRAEWGADESLLYAKDAPRISTRNARRTFERSDTTAKTNGCDKMLEQYPNEFRVLRTIKEENGKTLKWARRYSPDVRQIILHHTAQSPNDTRSGVERMRAIYKSHAVERGWGDIGYHYVIDEGGRIYEGRSGGRAVVGAHAYCHNVGTIGVAMMGNFDIDKPTQRQIQSAQWLIADLAKTYNIRPGATVMVKGKRMSTIVGHGDVSSTDCPGHFVHTTLSQIRRNVASDNYAKSITFPRTTVRTPVNRTDQRLSQRIPQDITVQKRYGLHALGTTDIVARPGGQVNTTLRFSAGSHIQRRTRIASIRRSSQRIGIEQELHGRYITVRDELVLPKDMTVGQSENIRLRITLPRESNLYTLDIGDITYSLKAEGRRIRTPKAEPTRQSFSPVERINVQTPGYRRIGRAPSTTNRSTSIAPARRRLVLNAKEKTDRDIRIALSHHADRMTVETSKYPKINGRQTQKRSITLYKEGKWCIAKQGSKEVASGIVRIDPLQGLNTITSWKKSINVFRGVIECRVVDDRLILINELPLEQYMAGLAEEPDTEPWEKQRAFAVAARSYAAFYLQPDQRKFPGKPYDGSDSPASFQMYGGYVFEKANPRWVEAVRDTAHSVLKKNRQVIKAAYFSTNDGRTRAPGERGWKNFPFAEVFRSKPDPWCKGLPMNGHGVGMSGCGAGGQAREGKIAEEILQYYYPGTRIESF